MMKMTYKRMGNPDYQYYDTYIPRTGWNWLRMEASGPERYLGFRLAL